MDPFEALASPRGGVAPAASAFGASAVPSGPLSAGSAHGLAPPLAPGGSDHAAAAGAAPLAALAAGLRLDGSASLVAGMAMPPPPPPPPPPAHWADFPVTAVVAALFTEADADGDGAVGRGDAKAFFARTGVPGATLAKARPPRARCRVRHAPRTRTHARSARMHPQRARALPHALAFARSNPRNLHARLYIHPRAHALTWHCTGRSGRGATSARGRA
jgi:hypothetical protein